MRRMIPTPGLPLGLGMGWRRELAAVALRRPDLGFVEVVAESIPADRPLPLPLEAVRRRGVQVVPHGVRLSLGSACAPDPARLAALARLAERVDAPLVSEHIAFVRSGGVEAGHLLPVPRTRVALEVLVGNVSAAMAALPVPLALEPIATLFEWPGAEIDEGDFVTELLERTGALLLLDVANLYANARNHGYDPVALLDRLPLDRLAYVHVAGGREEAGLYHDSHAGPVPPAVLDLLAHLAGRRPVPGVMLERDSHFPPAAELDAELDAISSAARLDRPHRQSTSVRPGVASGRPSSATDEDRARLAAEQSQLVDALVSGSPPAAAFDARRVDAAAAALVGKRAHEVARGHPFLVDALGAQFRPQFAAYVATHPLPAGGGACSDATAFSEWLAGQDRRPERKWRGSMSLDDTRTARYRPN
jgi:uncharacterized protein (UPF0276 family)